MTDTAPLHSFPIAGRIGRFLFLCAFIRDRRLVLVSTYYPDVLFDFREVDVTVDGLRIEGFEEIGLDEFEPTRAVVYSLRDVRPHHEVVVAYRGERRTYTIATDESAGRPRLAVATLFKDDHGVVDTFVRYYRGQGVERFYLFYNGDLRNVRSLLPDGDDIVYGSWDLPYAIDLALAASPEHLVDPAVAHSYHHAQTGFLTMVRHRYLDACSFLALIDLDEYLHLPDETLKTHLERVGAATLTVRNYWAEVRRDGRWTPDFVWKSRLLRSAIFVGRRVSSAIARRLFGKRDVARLTYGDLGRVWANVRNEGGKHVKTIYRGDYRGLFGIHAPKHAPSIAYSDSIRLIHLANCTRDRSNRIAPDAQPIALVGVAE